MAVCKHCQQEMTDGAGCTLAIFDDFPDAIARHRIPYPADVGQPCHDCRVPPGAFHHPGCDDERCPRCGGQAIGCNCLDGDDRDEEPVTPTSTAVPIDARVGDIITGDFRGVWEPRPDVDRPITWDEAGRVVRTRVVDADDFAELYERIAQALHTASQGEPIDLDLAHEWADDLLREEDQ